VCFHRSDHAQCSVSVFLSILESPELLLHKVTSRKRAVIPKEKELGRCPRAHTQSQGLAMLKTNRSVRSRENKKSRHVEESVSKG